MLLQVSMKCNKQLSLSRKEFSGICHRHQLDKEETIENRKNLLI